MKFSLKCLRGGCSAGLMIALASANELAPGSAVPEGISRQKEDSFSLLDLKIAELAPRLNAQVDASIGDPTTVGSGSKNEATTVPKEADLRPLYLRRHGISAGTRVEWVPPADKAPPSKAVEGTGTRPAAALQPYLDAAEAGDAEAMTLLGLIYHQGEGVPRDLLAAHDWYLKAATKGEGDAINNLGALYWDGFAGRRNRKIAYVVFLAASRSGEGTDQTRARAQRTLDRLAGELSQAERQEALSYTWPYVRQVLRSQGTDFKISPEVLPAKDRPRIRDNGWWRESERLGMTFQSPPPWDVHEESK